MSTKDKVQLGLRAFEQGSVDYEYTTDFIMREISKKKWDYAFRAFAVGMIVGSIVIKFLA